MLFFWGCLLSETLSWECHFFIIRERAPSCFTLTENPESPPVQPVKQNVRLARPHYRYEIDLERETWQPARPEALGVSPKRRATKGLRGPVAHCTVDELAPRAFSFLRVAFGVASEPTLEDDVRAAIAAGAIGGGGGEPGGGFGGGAGGGAGGPGAAAGEDLAALSPFVASCESLRAMTHGAGRSGAEFYRSADGKVIFKTVSATEVRNDHPKPATPALARPSSPRPVRVAFVVVRTAQ